MSLKHRAGPCVECGEPFPCRGALDERNRAMTLLAIKPGGQVSFERSREGTFVVGYDDARLPIDDPDVRAMLEATGWTFGEHGGMTYDPRPL